MPDGRNDFSTYRHYVGGLCERRSDNVGIPMTKALRDNQDKPDFTLLFDYMPKAFEELLKARNYGIKKYTRDGIDGRSNFLSSLRKEEHNVFKEGCRASAFRHLMKVATEGMRDKEQDDVLHVAFAALNCLMWLEYNLNEEG